MEIRLEAGKYYECCVGHVFKRTKRAKNPWLPCGHYTKREISKEEYYKKKRQNLK